MPPPKRPSIYQLKKFAGLPTAKSLGGIIDDLKPEALPEFGEGAPQHTDSFYRAGAMTPPKIESRGQAMANVRKRPIKYGEPK